jgi:branched-subunit amino acid transport protein
MNIWLIFLFAAIGTYLVRLSGVVLLRHPENIPAPIQRALRMVAPAALGAIIVNSLFLDQHEWRAFGAWHIAAAVAIIVALWRRSQGWSMLAGALVFAAIIAAT